MDKDTDNKEIAVDVMKVRTDQQSKDRDRQVKQADANKKLQADVAKELLNAARGTGTTPEGGGNNNGG